MKQKKFCTITYGCQMNESDSEEITTILKKEGYVKSNDISESDLIIINTCSVREHAAVKVYGKLGELKSLKEKTPELLIGVCGCLAESDSLNLAKKAKHLDFILGTRKEYLLPNLLSCINDANKPVIWVGNTEDEHEKPRFSLTRESNIKAWVPITEGCSYFCSFCIVPYVRGKQISRHSESIIAEVEQLAKEGYKEITLLGQAVNSYGKDNKEEIKFSSLLKLLDKIGGIERIRYMSSHPKDMTEELIKTIADSKKVCEHFHLPVQSGSDDVLKKMKRGYKRADFEEIVNKIRKYMPYAGISTDFIVGFPGETEEDFKATIKLVKDMQFDSAFTFKYSTRNGTTASKMQHQIESCVKEERLKELNNMQNEISLKKNQELVGKTHDVLVEGISSKNKNKLSGRTRTSKLVNFEGTPDIINKTVKIHITKAFTWTLEGRYKKNKNSI